MLDKKNIANQVQIGTTYPVVYLFTEGKYESSWPFSLKKKSLKETTSILLDKDKILLGLCVEDKYYKDSIKITNIGDRELFITDILTSCDCTEIQWSGTSVPSGESKIIYI